MREVRNKTARPLRIPLPGGKLLHLGPAQTAQISHKAAQHAPVRRLVEEDSIEILGEGEHRPISAMQGPGPAETHGKVGASFHRRLGE